MTTDFPLFSSLPAELRFRIWRFALTSSWSCTVFKNVGQNKSRNNLFKSVGIHPHVPISQTCTESHHVLTATYSYIERLGWFYFPRHLLFIRDFSQGPGPRRLQSRYALFNHVQHIVLNPSSRQLLYETVEYLAKVTTALRSIVLVGPWFLPDDRDTYDPGLDWMAPYEDWGAVIERSPADLDLATLLEALERGGDDDRTCGLPHGLSLDEYKARLDNAVRRLPDPLPDGLQPIDNLYWRTSYMLNKVVSIVQTIPAAPKLYLQKVEQIRPSSEDIPRETS